MGSSNQLLKGASKPARAAVASQIMPREQITGGKVEIIDTDQTFPKLSEMRRVGCPIKLSLQSFLTGEEKSDLKTSFLFIGLEAGCRSN